MTEGQTIKLRTSKGWVPCMYHASVNPTEALVIIEGERFRVHVADIATS